MEETQKRKSPKGIPLKQEESQAKKAGIGKRISELRLERNITISELAKSLEQITGKSCSPSKAGRMETDNSVSIEDVKALSKLFGVSADYLIFGTEEKYRNTVLKTGLSETALRKIEQSEHISDVINDLLSSRSGEFLLCSLDAFTRGSDSPYYDEFVEQLTQTDISEYIEIAFLLTQVNNYRREKESNGKT